MLVRDLIVQGVILTNQNMIELILKEVEIIIGLIILMNYTLAKD
jgi:hypothetical protein